MPNIEIHIIKINQYFTFKIHADVKELDKSSIYCADRVFHSEDEAKEMAQLVVDDFLENYKEIYKQAAEENKIIGMNLQ